MKILKFSGVALGIVLGAIILVLVLMLMVGIPSSFLTSTIQDRVERETGYRLTVAGTTRIRLWPTLNVTLTDVTFQDPRDHDGTSRLSIGGVAADLTLASAWSGHPEITTLVVTRPELHVPLLRDRLPATGTKTADKAAPSPDDAASAVTIKRVIISDGAVVM